MTVGPVMEYHQVIIREQFLSCYGGNNEQFPACDIKHVTITKFDRHDYLLLVEWVDEQVHDWMITASNVMLQFHRLGWIPYGVTMKSDVRQ